jgi:hypothetical protein
VFIQRRSSCCISKSLLCLCIFVFLHLGKFLLNECISHFINVLVLMVMVHAILHRLSLCSTLEKDTKTCIMFTLPKLVNVWITTFPDFLLVFLQHLFFFSRGQNPIWQSACPLLRFINTIPEPHVCVGIALCMSCGYRRLFSWTKTRVEADGVCMVCRLSCSKPIFFDQRKVKDS